MSKEKAIEICINLEQSIDKALNSIITSKTFLPFTTNKSKLKEIQKKVMEKYNLTKKDLL